MQQMIYALEAERYITEFNFLKILFADHNFQRP